MAYKLGGQHGKIQRPSYAQSVAHIDPLGALALILFRFGWAKPVPVNAPILKIPRPEWRSPPGRSVSNLLAALVGALLYNLIWSFSAECQSRSGNWISIFFSFYISVNVGLAVFNLIRCRRSTVPNPGSLPAGQGFFSNFISTRTSL